MNCIIRPCTVKDCKVVLQFIKSIAIDYKVPPTDVKVTLEVLREDGFGARPQYECYLAELPPGQTNKEGGSVVGYVLFTYTYSTWKGRNLYMDNLYVQPQFRGQKIGKRLIEKAAQAAVSKGCGQLRMHVANWKAKDKDFLARQGGEDLTAKEGWTLFNLDEDALRRLAAQSTI
ncbi:thialysine N-epsilon-acetyltransferase-like [Chelonoidis abingdonii]|uniref:thialysine N-epsilon-acetyltransferase-like n=1 Tax=Chelonoidis abingdonii TaxID=106734 RepID=UPI0013F2917A|nr:diamine acetyltransferase 2-like [Chelonoidis abingdonii]